MLGENHPVNGDLVNNLTIDRMEIRLDLRQFTTVNHFRAVITLRIKPVRAKQTYLIFLNSVTMGHHAALENSERIRPRHRASEGKADLIHESRLELIPVRPEFKQLLQYAL